MENTAKRKDIGLCAIVLTIKHLRAYIPGTTDYKLVFLTAVTVRLAGFTREPKVDQADIKLVILFVYYNVRSF